MLLQALPIMLVLFLLFPRVPGPFWSLPTATQATTGLGDSMAPGDITELSLSSDVAFRVRFAGAAPPPAQRYWRGPVLHDFDGYTWSRKDRTLSVRDARGLRPEYDYTLMLEPTDGYWVFALDMPVGWNERDQAALRLSTYCTGSHRRARHVQAELTSALSRRP